MTAVFAKIADYETGDRAIPEIKNIHCNLQNILLTLFPSLHHVKNSAKIRHKCYLQYELIVPDETIYNIAKTHPKFLTSSFLSIKSSSFNAF